MPNDPVLVFIQRNEASSRCIQRFKVDEPNRVERKVLSLELVEMLVRFWREGLCHVVPQTAM